MNVNVNPLGRLELVISAGGIERAYVKDTLHLTDDDIIVFVVKKRCNNYEMTSVELTDKQK